MLIRPTWQHSSGRKEALIPGVAIYKLHGKLHQHSVQGLCFRGTGTDPGGRG